MDEHSTGFASHCTEYEVDEGFILFAEPQVDANFGFAVVASLVQLAGSAGTFSLPRRTCRQTLRCATPAARSACGGGGLVCFAGENVMPLCKGRRLGVSRAKTPVPLCKG